MRWAAALVLFGACAAVPLQVATAPKTLRAEALEGTWHVVATNFPMWLDGARTRPTFSYANVRTDEGEVKFDDTVGYVERGAPGAIVGVDTQHRERSAHFTWRGRGVLALFTSDWDVVALDEQGQWAVIAFTPTLFTPAGVDIIARAPALDEPTLQQVRALIAADPVLAPLAHGLTTLP